MAWWQWLVAAIEAALLTILTLLWHDTLRERGGWRPAEHRLALVVPLAAIPIVFVVMLLVPLWLALILLAVPALAIIAMALAS
jgi:hypothetical protein